MELSSETNKIMSEVSRLRRTITALAALCSEDPGFDDLGITDAVTEIMESEKTLVTTNDVVEGLSALGFDVSSHENPAASVHAVLTRLSMKGKIERVKKGDSKVVYWKGPKYEPSAGHITDEDIPF